MCNVKAEDAGEIRFAARDVESIAYLEVEGRSARMLKLKKKKKQDPIQSNSNAPHFRAARFYRKAPTR